MNTLQAQMLASAGAWFVMLSMLGAVLLAAVTCWYQTAVGKS